MVDFPGFLVYWFSTFNHFSPLFTGIFGPQLANTMANSFIILKPFYMSITIATKISRNKKKLWYYLEWGKAAGQRAATGIYTYTKPQDIIEKNHNKESLATLKTKQSQMILERQAIGSGYIPQHKLKSNFFDYYDDFVKANKRKGNRHLQSSLNQFKSFTGKIFISPIDITETLCEGYRAYLLEHFNGETPSNYFAQFKKVLKAAKKAGYFLENPSEMIKSKGNPNKKKKEVIEADEYIQLLNAPCGNYEVKKAYIFCIYQGLRWCDVKPLKWDSIGKDVTRLQQKKTKVLLEIPLHPIAAAIVGEHKTGLVFTLPTADGANKVIKKWCEDAGLEKHITWHCARLSFSVLLQDEGVNSATVAGMLGHTTTKYVESTYQPYRVHVGRKAIEKLPTVTQH
jgi:integrase